ncbi:PACE efflux transporter [Paraburkholderia tropica]|uniref:PACE efflux transporter n=1 Tax=Paraburkholderia tropica TaxID=92647 RepID=UPI002AB6C5B5|nr:PACE efflux transporter [Paraburkholderia tropica]
MNGVKRKLFYVLGFEALGVVIGATCLTVLGDANPTTTGPLAVMASSIALGWNLIYTNLFELWEKSRGVEARTVWSRILCAIGYQLTLVTMLIPLIAWWMQVSLLNAFFLDATLIVVMPCYAFLYNWGFDLLFGVPEHLTMKMLEKKRPNQVTTPNTKIIQTFTII